MRYSVTVFVRPHVSPLTGGGLIAWAVQPAAKPPAQDHPMASLSTRIGQDTFTSCCRLSAHEAAKPIAARIINDWIARQPAFQYQAEGS